MSRKCQSQLGLVLPSIWHCPAYSPLPRGPRGAALGGVGGWQPLHQVGLRWRLTRCPLLALGLQIWGQQGESRVRSSRDESVREAQGRGWAGVAVSQHARLLTAFLIQVSSRCSLRASAHGKLTFSDFCNLVKVRTTISIRT